MSFAVKVTQFLRPNGKPAPQETDLGDETLKPKYEEMCACGLRFTAESLPIGGLVSLCVEDPARGDMLTAVVKNGPSVQAAMENMLSQFSREKYLAWAAAVEDAGQDDPDGTP